MFIASAMGFRLLIRLGFSTFIAVFAVFRCQPPHIGWGCRPKWHLPVDT
jgi:hypothetical protein